MLKRELIWIECFPPLSLLFSSILIFKCLPPSENVLNSWEFRLWCCKAVEVCVFKFYLSIIPYRPGPRMRQWTVPARKSCRQGCCCWTWPSFCRQSSEKFFFLTNIFNDLGISYLEFPWFSNSDLQLGVVSEARSSEKGNLLLFSEVLGFLGVQNRVVNTLCERTN